MSNQILTQTQIPSLTLQSNPHQKLYQKYIKENNSAKIEDLGYTDGLFGLAPLDCQFYFYYSRWCQGFAMFMSSQQEQTYSFDFPEIGEFDLDSIDLDNMIADLDNSDDSCIDYEEQQYYPPSSLSLAPIPLSTHLSGKKEDDNDPIVYKVTQSEIATVVENIVYERTSGTNIDADEKEIALLLIETIQNKCEQIQNHPFQEIDSARLELCFPVPYSDHVRDLELSIPLPHTIR